MKNHSIIYIQRRNTVSEKTLHFYVIEDTEKAKILIFLKFIQMQKSLECFYRSGKYCMEKWLITQLHVLPYWNKNIYETDSAFMTNEREIINHNKWIEWTDLKFVIRGYSFNFMIKMIDVMACNDLILQSCFWTRKWVFWEIEVLRIVW